MEKPVSKRRGEIAIPEAGDGAYLRMDVDALERLEEAFGEDYFDVILKGLSNARIGVMKVCLSVSLNGAEIRPLLDKIPDEVSTDDIKARVYDALFVAVFGRTFKEQQDFEEKRLLEDMKAAQEDPQKAAALYSKLSAVQDTEPGSDPTKSAA